MTTTQSMALAYMARLFKPKVRRYARPGDLARAVDDKTGTSPALEVIDDALIDLMRAEGQQEHDAEALAVFMPPQEGKSQRVSRRFAEWLLDDDPALRIAIVSYGEALALRWGRTIKHDIAANPCRHPEGARKCDRACGGLHISLRADTQAAGEWETPDGGGVYCVGIGGPLSGRPVDVLIIDDPVKDRASAESETLRNTAWDWWESVAVERLGPNSRVVLIQCMTGDTPVLMGDGTEMPLRDVRPDDTVATYEDGELFTSTVRNWANRGPDSVFSIRMKSGTVVKANARHPFLTIQDGVETWQRTDQLRPGSLIRRVTGGNGAASPLFSEQQPTIYTIELDEVVEITPCGTEDVYDLQIDRTENFIANGLVSHNTRWHEDDLAGRMAARPSPLKWRTLRIPAICDGPDDPLGRKPGEELPSVRGRRKGHFRNLRANMSAYVFAGVYQQKPVAPEGNFFRRSAFRYWRPMEPWADGRERILCENTPVTMADCWTFITMDFAASLKSSADYTVASCWAVTPAGDLILLERRRARVLDHDHFKMAEPLRARWGAQTIYVEKNWWSQTFVTDATAAGVGVAPLTADTDKVTRATPAAGRVHAGKVWFPAETSGCECGNCPSRTDEDGTPVRGAWLEEWCDELAIFPQGSHDDQVDTLSYAVRVQIHDWTAGSNTEARPDPSDVQVTEAALSATGTVGHDAHTGDIDLMNVAY